MVLELLEPGDSTLYHTSELEQHFHTHSFEVLGNPMRKPGEGSSPPSHSSEVTCLWPCILRVKELSHLHVLVSWFSLPPPPREHTGHRL